MALKISDPIVSISKIDSSTHNVERINSVERRYKALRQDSKAPTFRPYLPRHLQDVNDELWFPPGKGQDGGRKVSPAI